MKWCELWSVLAAVQNASVCLQLPESRERTCVLLFGELAAGWDTGFALSNHAIFSLSLSCSVPSSSVFFKQLMSTNGKKLTVL